MRHNPDPGRLEADRLLARLETEIRRGYSGAAVAIAAAMSAYFMRFAAAAGEARGKMSAGDCKRWLAARMTTGTGWRSLLELVSPMLSSEGESVRERTRGGMAGAYAAGINYAAYDFARRTGADPSIPMFSREAVERILRDDPDLLPAPRGGGGTEAWHRQRMQSATLQAIMEGEGVPKMAKRVSEAVCTADSNAAVRYARTAMTGAENAGRLDAMARMKETGLPVRKTWLAVLDGRTRHAHRELDGVTAAIDEPFVNSLGAILFPGDPSADPGNVWNCRCTLVTEVGKAEDWSDLSLRHSSKMGGLSYEEWKSARAGDADVEGMAEVMRRGRESRNKVARGRL